MSTPNPVPVLRWIAASADADRTIPLPRAWQPADVVLLATMNPISSATLLLQQRYRDSLPTKHAGLSSRWQLLQENPSSHQAQLALQEALHRLAGSAGAYGYVTLGDLARDADAILIRHLLLPPSESDKPLPLQELDATLTQLLQQLEAAS